MNKTKTILVYAWAALGLPLALATFMGNEQFKGLFVRTTGLRVTPWATGGDVKKTIDHGVYQTRIRETVFQAFVGERAEGFVQVEWAPKDKIPPVIDEEIDYDADGVNDFKLVWNTKTNEATLTPLADAVKGLQGKYALKESFAIRVDLKNKNKK